MSENQKNTLKHINGKWLYEKDDTSLLVSISDNGVHIEKDGEEISLKRTADWFGFNIEYYIFNDQNKYYVRSADEKNLIFGKKNENTTTLGDYEWEYTLNRIG